MLFLQDGRTPLHLAAEYKDITVCSILVSAGANLNIQDMVGIHCDNISVYAQIYLRKYAGAY